MLQLGRFELGGCDVRAIALSSRPHARSIDYPPAPCSPTLRRVWQADSRLPLRVVPEPGRGSQA